MVTVHEVLTAKGIVPAVIIQESRRLTASIGTEEGKTALFAKATLDAILTQYRQERCRLVDSAQPLSIYATGLTGTNVTVEAGKTALSIQAAQSGMLGNMVQTEEHRIVLPREVDIFHTKTANEDVLAALTTIGIGLIKYDSLHV